MGLKALVVLIAIAISVNGESLYLSYQKERDSSQEIRGNSFGLENFLLQAYKDEGATQFADNRDTPAPDTNIRGLTYGLENLTPSLYSFNTPQLTPIDYYADFKPIITGQIETTNPEEQNQRRIRNKIRKLPRKPSTTTPEPISELNDTLFEYEAQKEVAEPSTEKPVEIQQKVETTPLVQIVETPEPEKEEVSERPKKRITMRRRRKRPTQNSETSDVPSSTPSNEVIETNETIKESETSSVPIETPPAPPKEEKERPIRKRPIGFRKTAPELKQTSTTAEAPTQELNETNAPGTTFIPETTSQKEESESPAPEELDLKVILKQQNGVLSLSELLQTQNLSLSDFLKNKKEAALLLSGKKGIQTTSPRTETKEYGRTPGQNFSSRSRPFIRNRNENTDKLSISTSTTERTTYNGFVPKNPRIRYGHFKGVYPTVKTKAVEVRENTTTTPNSANHTGSDNQSNEEQKTTPKRITDLRAKFNMHRRKFAFSTTTRTKEEKVEVTTLPATTLPMSSVEPTETPSSTTEDYQTTKRMTIKIPFKSSNNPELSLILPSKNKTEEKTKFSSFASRNYGYKKYSEDRNDLRTRESNNVEQTVTTKINLDNKLPLDNIEMDDEVDNVGSESSKQITVVTSEEYPTTTESKRLGVVGKIPQKYESKDEIVELLKTGRNSDILKRILESRNMTVEELLENREKSSSNFPQLFSDREESPQKKNEPATTEPGLRVFQSLPKFPPIHRNLYQKNVKDVKSNSYPDAQVEESRPVPVRVNVSIVEPREPKRLNGVVEIKRKLYTKPEPEENLGSDFNDWNENEKPIKHISPIPKSKPTASIKFPQEKFSLHDNVDDQYEESDIILLETLKKNQDANRKLKSNINEILQEQSEIKNVNKDTDKSFIPPGVKSAIIASGVVMGLALLVFVAIFAACGWKQRHIRLKAHSSILNDALAKSDTDKKVQRTNTLSPINFKQNSMYKKSLDLDDGSESSVSASSNASSYLWNTLKNTFSGRTMTLKNRLDKEDKIREDRLDGLKGVLRNQETRKTELIMEVDGTEDRYAGNGIRRQEERYSARNDDCMKRNSSFNSTNHFTGCSHGH